ncbi:MAG: response regulator [Planctomycetota bacterium]
MLVLTRRSEDLIHFPEVGITVHFLRVRSGQARVGVDAPKHISILRGELGEEPGVSKRIGPVELARLPKRVRHAVRNDLHQISLGVHLYRELLSAGRPDEAEVAFNTVRDVIKRLDESHWLQRPSDVLENHDDSPGLPKTTQSGGRALAIAIVEDDHNEREMLAGFLRLKGYSVSGFADGRQALDGLGSATLPDVIIVDMQMPICDGGEMVRALRENPKYDGCAIYAVSASSPEECGLEIGTKLGVDDWFPKPLNPKALMDTVDQRAHA